MTTAGVHTIRELADEYLAGVPAGRRGSYHRDVHRFIRWVGPDRTPESLTGHEVERFGTEVVERNPATAEAVRAFLGYLKKKGYTSTNLGTNIRIRRTGARPGAATAHAPQETIKMTAEGLAKLQEELAALVAQRPQVAEELRRAMADKDFRENAPLDAARDRQAHLEARIRDLEARIRLAEVVEAPAGDTETAQLGTSVVLYDERYKEEVRYTLVSPNEVDLRKGRLSLASPTGKALLGKRVGDIVEVEAPGGTHRYKVVRIET